MPNISVKNVPDAWAQALRQRAERNHRSLQGELMAIIEVAVQEPLASIPGPRLQGHRTGWKSVEQVVAELDAKYPNPEFNHVLPRGVDIIREDRDSR